VSGCGADGLLMTEIAQAAGVSVDIAAARATRRRTMLVFAPLVLLLLAYLVSLVVRKAGAYSTLLDGWLVSGFEITASLLCLFCGFRGPQRRLVPIVLGVAALSWSLGDVALTIESTGGATPPVPSVADGFYLTFFPLAYVGIALFMRGEVRRLANPSWLDSSIAAVGAAAVCATFAFHSVLQSAGSTALSVATNLAYPIGDLLLLGLVVGGTAMLSGRRRTPWLLLAGGMALNAAGDTFNLFGSSVGSTHIGTIVNGIAWPTSIVMITLAMWLPPGHSDPLALERPPGFVMPGIAAIAGLAVLLVGTFTHPGPVAVGLATVTLALVGIRLAKLTGHLRALTRKRHQQAVTDQLTGIGNRRYLFDVLEAWFADRSEGAGPPRELSFLFIDLDRFKEINDSFGHPAGDELLRQIGARFRTVLRDSDALVRFGGDEFAALLVDSSAADAKATAARIAGSMTNPFVLDSVSVEIGASIGIARAPSDATDADGLVSCADLAMYRAKLGGETYAFYESDRDEQGSMLRLAEELGAAIDKGELLVHYQPQLDLQTGEIQAVEALLRWRHPSHGVIPPLRFLPLAEQAGLMGRLTRWVLDQSLAQCAAWRNAGANLTVSVNVSPTNLLDPGFGTQVQEQLDHHGVPPEALVLEITETCIIREFERSKAVVEGLRGTGVTVSIDDFGTGFTSLAYLSGLAVGQLKLDRTFISRLASARHDRDLRLVRSTIDLGHALDMEVVAEGIEDDKTLELLRELGCDTAQGFFIGHPTRPDELALLPPVKPETGSAPRTGELPPPPFPAAQHRAGGREAKGRATGPKRLTSPAPRP
jgi:diguanylate cyclase